MNLLRCACAAWCLVLSICVAQADDNDAAAHDLAAQCAAKNGTFDESSKQCTEPAHDSASGDLAVGPMMQVLEPQAQDADGHAATGQ